MADREVRMITFRLFVCSSVCLLFSVLITICSIYTSYSRLPPSRPLSLPFLSHDLDVHYPAAMPFRGGVPVRVAGLK